MIPEHPAPDFRDCLLQVRTFYAHRPLPRSGTTRVLMICQDGSALEVISDMVSLGERLEVGRVRVALVEARSPDLADLVPLGRISEPAEVGWLEVEVTGQRVVSGLFFRSAAGEVGIVAAALPVHLTWYGAGLSESDGPPEYDMAAYRRAVL